MHSVLLHNTGRSAPGVFENRTAAAGLVQPVGRAASSGYAALWADLDGNGYPDLFLVADYSASQLWWNNGDGTFTNGTATSGTSVSGIPNGVDAMGAALLDYDGDGKLDIFVSGVSINFLTQPSQYASKNLLYRNLGNQRFQENATTAGVIESGWGWGAETLDANNDGLPDLFVTNGFQAVNNNYVPALTDPSRLFINRGGSFTDLTPQYGITDTGLGRSVVVLDYDNDGREDIFVTQTVGHRILYRNALSSANTHWLALQFRGTTSNRDGYGCEVTVTAGGRSQVAVYNPTNAYIGQREPRLHFGLGASTTVDRISIKWPGGAMQELTAVAADQILSVTEPGDSGSGAPPSAAPVITVDPRSTSTAKDGSLTLSAAAQGSPAPVFNWFKDGVRIAGATGATLILANVQPIDQGTYTVTATNQNGTVTSQGATVTVTADLAAKSIAHWWNEALLDGIRKDTPNPPVHARNLFHLSATLWDTFWAYERDGWATQHEMFVKETPVLPTAEADRLAAQREAMSYAAYTLIKQRFAKSPGAAATLAGIRWLMQQYGFDPDVADITGNSPSAVGLRICQQILARNLTDGANEADGYADATGYRAANPPLVVRNPGVGDGVDPDYWQPLDLANTITQNGIVLGASTQKFVGSNARATKTFALLRRADGFLTDDPGAPPRFSGSSKQEYVAEARQVILFSSQLTTADGATIDISPGKILNNPLMTNDGTGHPKNPVTGQPYASNVALRGDYARVLAEFWADGPNSETPPGHWNVLFNQVSDHPLTEHKFMGRGPVLRRLEWDVAGYLVLNGALHDAACAAWTLKWEYDSARPITMIRYLASRGQSSDSAQPNYSPDGLPLEPGLIELITAESSAPGQRHALGVNWVPYQRETFVTPAFPGYISGHSTFSRAGAEVVSLFTGSEFFPGGLATYDFAAGKGLGFEAGPANDVQLQWATYADAADQAGLSRLYGGIHISTDDFMGRGMGSVVGIDAFELFAGLYTPPTSSAPAPTTPASPGTPPAPA
ncbi:MAG: VCBS repeat-containing protein, partial [Opitutae bacterium]|nr:VCBS repeat-containing protein [Opitutae bacterium]